MKKKYFVAGLLLFLFTFTCCTSLSQYISKGCFWWECAPDRTFSVLDWDIPVHLLPDGSVATHIARPTDNILGEIEAGLQTIHIEYSVAIYNIYRFPRQKDAINKFEHDKENMIDSKTGALWVAPSELQFVSKKADDMFVGCGYWSDIYRCKMIARYQEYYIFFNADIDEKMTFVYFERILFYLDEQISSRLYP